MKNDIYALRDWVEAEAKQIQLRAELEDAGVDTYPPPDEDDMNVEDLYKSKSQWLNADDIEDGRDYSMTVKNCTIEEIGDGQKLVVWFNGAKKGLGLNKTNWNALRKKWGPKPERWTGKTLVLYQDITDYQGRQVDCVRVRVPNEPVQEQRPMHHPMQPEPEFNDSSDIVSRSPEPQQGYDQQTTDDLDALDNDLPFS